jgi:hypothetical protein
VVLADTSGSMVEEDAGEGRSRMSILREALGQLPSTVRLIAFSDEPEVITSARELPKPNGRTRLDRAIRMAATFKPIRTVIVSDGEPDSREAAVTAVLRLTGIVVAAVTSSLALTVLASKARLTPSGSERRS